MICIFLSALLPRAAQATEPFEPVSAGAQRVGLLVLGDSSQGGITQEVADELAESGATLIRWQPIAPVDASAVASLEALREAGESLYYFEGAAQAQAQLAAPVARHLEISQPWMARSEASQALFDVAMLLVRSYLDRGQASQGQRVMAQVVEALPAHRPDERGVPPEVVDLWRGARQRVADDQARLVWSHWDDQNCQIWLNGQAVDESATLVAPNRTYLMVGQCDEGPATRQWISAGAGQMLAVPRLSEILDDDGDRGPLAQWMTQKRLHRLVIIGPGNCAEQEQPCIAVYEAGEIVDAAFAKRDSGLDGAEELGD